MRKKPILKTALCALTVLTTSLTPLANTQTAFAEPMRRDGFDGYDHPNQFMHRQANWVADNMMPVITHPEQDAEAFRRLDELYERTGQRPNVLIFLVDDMGWSCPGFNGGGGTFGQPTPDLDFYASQGLVLTSAYSQPTSSPTRATILTGQYPIHHGVLRPAMYGEAGGLEGATTIAALMSDLGYVTSAIGKWHMGENTASLPQNVGFDYFRGFLSVSNMYTEWRDAAFNPEIALSPSRLQMMLNFPFERYEVRATRGGELVRIEEITTDYMRDLDQRWMQEGVDFIHRMADYEQPFFLYFCTRGPHFDNYPNEFYLGRSPARTTYADTIVEINDIFATLMRALEESGQAENTFVIFTSDNGPETEVPPHGHTFFRGSKGSTWEGGVRVPTFVYWPGMVAPGGRNDGLFCLSDIFPTVLALAGVRGANVGALVPETTFIAGIDQSSFLLAMNGQSRRRVIHYFLGARLSAVRIDEWKMHRWVVDPYAFTQTGHHGGNTGALVEVHNMLLFNLFTNPQEDNNVFVRHIPVSMVLLQQYQYFYQLLKRFPPHPSIRR